MHSDAILSATRLRLVGAGTALMLLSACGFGAGKPFDWDFRPLGLSTADAARGASASRPAPDARGVISYPGYQVAVAQRGDTVAGLAGRLGIDAGELARYNAVQPGDSLRAGEVIALPRRVAETGGATFGGGAVMGGAVAGSTITGGTVVGSPIRSGPIDVASVAGPAITRATPTASAGTTTSAPAGWQTGASSASTAPGVEPARHQVRRGETAYTIARSYNVPARDLAEWNGLDSNLSVREGQYLLIPVLAAGAAAATATIAAAPEPLTVPGAGTPTPVPPSAARPLPAQDEPPIATAKPAASAQTTAPAAPKPVADLGASRSGSAKLAMPVGGQIIRGYAKGKNDGIDIGASAGTAVAAAGDGTVAAITRNTDGVPILVIRHADNLLTVYGGIDAVAVEKGATVKRGQRIATVRAGNPSFLHFEVRKGFESVDPMGYLQ